MKLHRFILESFEDIQNEISDKEFINQVRHVLKLKKGEQIILSNGKGKEALFEIEDFHKDTLLVKRIEELHNTNEPGIQVMLYCAMLKKENFELVCQKATEIGVKEICPIITERTVKTGFTRARLEKIIKEAAEQSERAVLPVLKEPISFSEALTEANTNDANFLFDKQGETIENKGIYKVGCFIGPEGGFTDAEKQLAKDHGVTIASLGKLTLRAETAAIAAVYKLINQ